MLQMIKSLLIILETKSVFKYQDLQMFPLEKLNKYVNSHSPTSLGILGRGRDTQLPSG